MQQGNNCQIHSKEQLTKTMSYMYRARRKPESQYPNKSPSTSLCGVHGIASTRTT